MTDVAALDQRLTDLIGRLSGMPAPVLARYLALSMLSSAYPTLADLEEAAAVERLRQAEDRAWRAYMQASDACDVAVAHAARAATAQAWTACVAAGKRRDQAFRRWRRAVGRREAA